MKLIVNGKEQQLPDGTTLVELIKQLGLDAGPCAAEVNKKLVPKKDHAATPLNDGDRVELVTLVGGG
jgi:sulfur carrier protein